MAGGDGLADSLARLGVIGTKRAAPVIAEVCDWYRSGAETYAYVFDVHYSCRGVDVSRRCWLKACVALGSGGVGDIAAQWLERRGMIEKLVRGSTPSLFGSFGATILEEDIPFSIVEAYRGASSAPRLTLVRNIGVLVGALASCGFPVLDLSDLRSRGDDAVVIDFGSDLGPPGLASREQVVVLDQVLSVFDRARQPLRPEELVALEAGYSRGST